MRGGKGGYQLYQGGSAWGFLAGGPPRYEFGFGDGEGNSQISSFLRDVLKDSLQAADFVSVGLSGHRDGRIVNLGEHEAPRYRRVEGGDLSVEEEGGRLGTPVLQRVTKQGRLSND